MHNKFVQLIATAVAAAGLLGNSRKTITVSTAAPEGSASSYTAWRRASSPFALLAADSLPPIACNLKALTSEQRKQLAHIGEHVISAIGASRELANGYAFRIDPTKASLLDVAQWLDLWRRCCPFYEFQVQLQAADAVVWLSVTGRPGVKEYIPIDVPQLVAKLPR